MRGNVEGWFVVLQEGRRGKSWKSGTVSFLDAGWHNGMQLEVIDRAQVVTEHSTMVATAARMCRAGLNDVQDPFHL